MITDVGSRPSESRPMSERVAEFETVFLSIHDLDIPSSN
jgi:hypothetical protein